MNWYFIKTPGIFRKIFCKYTWSFIVDKKEIYLTFDDGPVPVVTEFVLDELKKYNAKATFFCIGDNIKKNPDIFCRILKEGHSIGNHTNNHLNGWKTSTAAYVENTLLCESSMVDFKYKVVCESKLFRPPYGKLKRSQAKQLLKRGYKIIMWTVLSADFDKSITKEKCLHNVINNVKNGSIVVFHDSIKASGKLYYTLPRFLEEFSKKGYVFKKIA
ncbi:polysaccharide deacetylase family protein [Tenacibaculum aestuariivivum]|uniref:polysaccharide deacetylase family protein n=1 Tax=Tenacibaculum aestuariivivum TaxID=2006131 RepID=UPI003AB15ACF